ncbi:hypothetical protein Avbf_00958 [Armadillidium vulgare]|nr:hypothetical protein Avbf_00958 [Armadillidium vulgare]
MTRKVIWSRTYLRQIQEGYLEGWLREKGGKKPQLPNDTRWNSQCACVDTFIQNFPLYIEIRNKHSAEILQSDSCSLGDACSPNMVWRFLKTQYYNHTKL